MRDEIACEFSKSSFKSLKFNLDVSYGESFGCDEISFEFIN